MSRDETVATQRQAHEKHRQRKAREREEKEQLRTYRELRTFRHEKVREELHRRFGDDQRIDPEDDPIAWRRKIRCHPVIGPFYRMAIGVIGLALIVLGFPMVPLVGPGWAVIFIGLYLWSTEFMWARRLTQFVKAEVLAFNDWVQIQPLTTKVPLAAASTAFAWGCMWFALTLTGVPSWIPDLIERYLTMLPGLGA